MSKRVTISTLNAMKQAGEKFVMVTAYDATFARLVSEAGAEAILVGDSLGMVLQGHDTTIPVSIDDSLKKTVKEWAFEEVTNSLKIMPAQLSGNAVPLGAASLVIKNYFEQM